jgi:tRNA (adenine57-N1/adenine58-N1)-methyltransferase
MKKEKKKIKEGDSVLLLSRERNYLVKVEGREFNTDYGVVNLKEIIGKQYGIVLKTHKDYEFAIVEPSIIDFINKKIKKKPQAIRPKDFALIIAFTGLKNNAIVVEAGTGSAWTTLMLASYCVQGKIYSYEIRKDFFENAKKNIETAGVENVVLKNKDILLGIEEKDVDLVVLDMINAEKVIVDAYKVLKPGGWLVVFSPYIEQVKDVVKEIEEYNFSKPFTTENILRYWDVRRHTLPKRYGIVHTGWLTFARKIF